MLPFNALLADSFTARIDSVGVLGKTGQTVESMSVAQPDTTVSKKLILSNAVSECLSKCTYQ